MRFHIYLNLASYLALTYASHSSNVNSHARRSLLPMDSLEQRQNLGGLVDKLGDTVGGVGNTGDGVFHSLGDTIAGSDHPSPPPSSSTPATPTHTSVTVPETEPSPPTTVAASATDVPDSITPTQKPETKPPTTSAPEPSTTSPVGLLPSVVNGLTSDVGDVGSGLTSALAPTSVTVSDPPKSTPKPSDSSSGSPSDVAPSGANGDTLTSSSTVSSSTGDLIGSVVSSLPSVVSSLPSDVGDIGSGLTSALAPTSVTVSDPPKSTPKPADSSSGTTSDVAPSSGSNGGILDTLTSAILPHTSSSSQENVPSVSSDTHDFPTNSPSPSSSDSGPLSSPTITPAPSPTPTDSSTSPSSSSTGLLGSILPPILSPILSPTSTDSSTFDPPASSSGGGSSLPITSSDAPASPTDSPSSSNGGILSSILSSILSPTSSDNSPNSATPSQTGASSVSPTDSPVSSITSVGSSSVLGNAPTSVQSSVATDSSGAFSSAVSGVPSSVLSSFASGASSSVPSILLPSGNISVISQGQSPVASVTTSPSITSISVNSALSFVLTASSLAVNILPTPTASATLTDPDMVPTTALSSSEVTGTALPVVAIPTDLPSRIYPNDGIPANADHSGQSLISILFTQELNWAFVVNNSISSSQIFAYMPVLIQSVFESNQVQTFALQVFVPTSYRNPSDRDELGTMYLGYIQSSMVSTLAAAIKSKTSLFYTGVNDPVAQALAARVNSGFSIVTISSPDSPTPGSGDPGSPGPTGGKSDDAKTRQDAIIGVVSALGAVALLVLVFLVYRSMKRRRELAHRRISDTPDDVVGVRPEGRDFDQDSVGGVRRRSFYYAEDSLRGYGQRQEDAALMQPTASQMSLRRNIGPASISAPILQESSMNW